MMKIVTYGEIMDQGSSAFIVFVQLEKKHLVAHFKGVIRVDDPYKFLGDFIQELEEKLKKQAIERVTFDFTALEYCNSNGFYSVMDIIEIIYKFSHGSVYVKRLEGDDWQQQTLPVLLNLRNADISKRTLLENIACV